MEQPDNRLCLPFPNVVAVFYLPYLARLATDYLHNSDKVNKDKNNNIWHFGG